MNQKLLIFIYITLEIVLKIFSSPFILSIPKNDRSIYWQKRKTAANRIFSYTKIKIRYAMKQFITVTSVSRIVRFCILVIKFCRVEVAEN